jgi:DNA-binding response OmpR family regulator
MTILVVEDQKTAAENLKRMLEQEHYEVDIAFDGQEGLEKAELNGYDVIVLDIMLPKMNGFEVCKKLREKEITTPIIMLTCLDAVEERVRGLDAGAEDYLAKPFKVSELLARIRSLLRREHRTQPTILQVADLTLDPAAHEVKRNGEVVRLSKKEYQLLDYMMRRPGQVCHRTAIGEHIWGYKFDERRSRVIETTISTLRKKIDRGFRRQLIHTIRDFGYQIKSDLTQPKRSNIK